MDNGMSFAVYLGDGAWLSALLLRGLGARTTVSLSKAKLFASQKAALWAIMHIRKFGSWPDAEVVPVETKEEPKNG